MNSSKKGIKILILIVVSTVYTCNAQIPTYSIDSFFNSGELFKNPSPVLDFCLMEENRILVGGTFDNEFLTGLGMIYSNGQLDNSWEGNVLEYYHVLKIIAQEDGYVWPDIYGMSKINLDGISWVYSIGQGQPYCEYFHDFANSPYNVQRIWDIYQMENGDLLLGGAIANDTLLPNELRGISRIHADGSHDLTFPVLNITPNFGNGAVHRIFRAPDESWYISGGFTAINGHETNRVAKLTPDFEVDTTFVSPFVYDGILTQATNIILVDEQSRVWLSGYRMRLQQNPNDTIQIIRLLPNGEVDGTFLPRKLENNYPDGWLYNPTFAVRAQEVEAHPGNYFVYGIFSHFNDTLQSCIAVVDDAGIIQSNFFQGQGATEYNINNQEYPQMPAIAVVKQFEDGSLLIGGGFSQFMGEERYSVVKLKPDSITANPPEIEQANFKLYPNPAKDMLYLSSRDAELVSGTVYNAIGQEVLSFKINTNKTQVDIQKLEAGIYFVQIRLENGQMGVRKFVKSM